MKSSFIYLISFFSIIKLFSLQIIEFHYTEFTGAFHTVIKMGSPYQSLLEGINLAHPFTVTSDYFYNQTYSTTVQILDKQDPFFNIDTKKFEGLRLIEKIGFGNIIVNGFNFYVIKSHAYDINKRRNGFSFPYKFKDESFSIVHLLRKNNLIEHLSFAIVPNDNSFKRDKGVVTFGGLSSNYTINKTATKCKVVNKDPYIAWSCRLSHVFIGEISHENNKKNVYYKNIDYAYFQTSTPKIIAPRPFIDFINEHLFNSLIKEELCEKPHGYQTNINCHIKSLYLMPNITFVFDSIEYTHNITTFFDCLISWCEFMIFPNEDNSWLIGTNFIRNYIMNFDYEDPSITFYSNQTRNTITLSDLTQSFKWPWVLIILGLIFLLLYGYYAFMQRRHIKRLPNNFEKNKGGVYNQL